MSCNDTMMYNWCFTDGTAEIILNSCKTPDEKCAFLAAPISIFSREVFQGMNPGRRAGRSADAFTASSNAAAIDSPPVYHVFPEQQLCVGVDADLSALFSCSSQNSGAPPCRLLSNHAKRTTKIYWILPNVRRMRGERGVGGGVQSAQNMKSIFYLAENFRRCVVCPLAHRSRGQLFEHPSLASVSSPEQSRAQDKLQPRGSALRRRMGRQGNELTGEWGRPC